MKWFKSLPPDDEKAFGKFFNSSEHFPTEAKGRALARMKEERFIAILGDALGADLYEELQKLKGKGAQLVAVAEPSCLRHVQPLALSLVLLGRSFFRLLLALKTSEGIYRGNGRLMTWLPAPRQVCLCFLFIYAFTDHFPSYFAQ
jgi:hypothetical protein